MGSFRRSVTGRAGWLAAFVLLLSLSCVAPVLADVSSEPPSASEEKEQEKPLIPSLPASEEIIEAINTEGVESIDPEPTDPAAAKEMPLQDLERGEALELLQAVFEPQLQAPAEIFDDLRVERFLADNVAVIPAGHQPGASTPTPDEESADYEGATLMESTMPLRTEGRSGKEEAIDLSLERSEGELRIANPLVEVDVPQELGEGIELPEAGVRIELEGAPEDRSPSNLDGSVAAYPNVEQDTDFIVAPTPTGFETLTQLRSPDAPHTQTFNMQLPPGATLRQAENGGAEVRSGDERTIVGIAPPTALDATGASVPVSMVVSGDSLTLEVFPDESTELPVLIDPLFQTYEWLAKNNHDGVYFNGPHEQWWAPGTIGANWVQAYRVYGTWYPLVNEMPGLYVASSGSSKVGDEAAWNYMVPRYFTDPVPPTSFIAHMTLSNLVWQAQSYYPSPYLWAGIWDPVNKGFVSFYSHEGNSGHSLNDMSYAYQFPNPNPNGNAKVAIVGMHATETTPSGGSRVYVGMATMQLGEPASDAPDFGSVSGPTGWVNQVASPIGFTVTDTGLGVYAITVSDQQSPVHSWKTAHGCVGVGGKACPRTWDSTNTAFPTPKYEPAVLPQGTNYLQLVAEDPLGKVSEPAIVAVKVDHTAPGLTLAGTITEQSTLGYKWPSYRLKVDAVDGTTAEPQSGVAKTVIKVDGEVVDEVSPGCSTKNCSISREWTLDASQYASGFHFVNVTATDTVGLVTTKMLFINLQPAPPPSISLSGSMTEQETLGTTRPRYKLNVDASAEAGIEASAPSSPTFASSFGSLGTGDGQLSKPGDVALDAQGNLWVVDRANNRVQKFNQQGQYISKFGSYGSANGQFNRPTSIAIDTSGNLWVSDANNNRIQKFSASGEFLKAIGSAGTGNGQFSGPEGIATDAQGNVWVADTYNQRVQKFNANGEFISKFGSYGSGPGQFGEANSIDIGPGGKVWVADWANNRVAQFTEAGEFVRNFGSYGTGDGQFNRPDAVEVDSKGNVFVGDQNNGRVQQFNEAGEYVTQFGTKGSGEGQFSFTWPMGIAVDNKGGIWVADVNNNRVQKWVLPADSISEISTTITLDGQMVDSAAISCTTEKCPVAREWTLDSSAYTVGQHSLQVKATDGFGRTTTKSLTVEVQRDTTKPTLEVGGELANAPEGWVEQDIYGLHASATDAGYGITSLAFGIDGNTVASVNQECAEGGCVESMSKSVDMSSYSGGAHTAELVATDGAGNATTRRWTINVDPEGHITVGEAIDTLEAADTTSESTVVAPTDQVLEPEQIEGGDNPGLQQAESEITSTGVPDTTTMTMDPENGFTIHFPGGATTITPVVNESSSDITIAEGVAGVSANVADEVDSVIRPQYDGAQTFEAIRSVDSPDSFSWTVALAEGQTLHLANSSQAEVLYEDGMRAFLISAEEAHDATGATVPTSLQVSGNILTLTVDHRSAAFVYPIVAGQGWETKYETPIVIEGPEDETELWEREQEELRLEQEALEAEWGGTSAPPPPPPPITKRQAERYLAFGPYSDPNVVPPPAPSGDASASSQRTFQLYRSACGLHCDHWKAKVYNASYIRGSDWVKWEPGTEVHADVTHDWKFAAIIQHTVHNCGTAGPNFVRKGNGEHLMAYGHFTIETWWNPFDDVTTVSPAENSFALQAWVYPNGFQERHIKDWEPPGVGGCPTVAG